MSNPFFNSILIQNELLSENESDFTVCNSSFIIHHSSLLELPISTFCLKTNRLFIENKV